MRITAVLFACGLALGAYTLNASSNPGLPVGWTLGGEAPKLYSAEIDKSDSPSGKGSVVLRRIASSHSYGKAYLVQDLPMAQFAGKRVRVSMHVRFQDIARKEGTIHLQVGEAYGEEAPNFSGDWDLFQTTLTVSANPGHLAIGVGLKGAGSAKVDGIEFKVLGDAPAGQRGVGHSDTLIVDKASDTLPAGWSLGGEAPKLFSTGGDMADSPSGKGSVVLRRSETRHSFGKAQLTQSFPVAPYAGKRVRLSMRVRFQDVDQADKTERRIYVGGESESVLDSPEFSGGWDLYQSTLNLPHDIRRLEIGVALKGSGSAKVDGIELQVLGDAPAGQRNISTSEYGIVGRAGK